MKSTKCLPQRISIVLLAVFMLVGAAGFAVLAFSFLPMVGFLVALPMFVLAVYIVRLRLNSQCEIV
ncbi:MAG: hypothetical protein GY737_29185 [Desulfobacteraceae bacterium]|nr:hypothetical protein [Desulfobacteraceae bacterium]